MEILFNSEFKIFSTVEYYDYSIVQTGEDPHWRSDGISRLKRPNDDWKYKCDYRSEEEMLKNYQNPACSVSFKKIKVVVSKTEEKVSIKFYVYNRWRNVGLRYFRTETLVRFITYNFKTNSLYYGSISNYHSKKKSAKFIRKNLFRFGPLRELSLSIFNAITPQNLSEPDFLIKRSVVAKDSIEVFLKNIPGYTESELNPDHQLYKIHLENNGIKLSNNWKSFTSLSPQPKKKDFKVNNLKYIDTIMFLHSLSGDKIKKILHRCNEVKQFDFFKWVVNVFGKDFIYGQSEDFIQTLLESNTNVTTITYKNFFISKKEKYNALEILKLVLIGEIAPSSFYDHFQLLSQLRRLEDVKWASNTYNKFLDEHYDLSEKVSFYRKGELTRGFNLNFIEKIQTPIKINNDTFYPVLLTTSKDYNIESFVQSNCVKTYTNKPGSIIISLRKDSVDSKERATIEIQARMINDKLDLVRTQSLGRFNKKLSEEWDMVLTILDSRINECLLSKIFTLPTVVYKIGNKILTSEIIFAPKIYYIGEDIHNDLKLEASWSDKYFYETLNGYNQNLNVLTNNLPL